MSELEKLREKLSGEVAGLKRKREEVDFTISSMMKERDGLDAAVSAKDSALLEIEKALGIIRKGTKQIPLLDPPHEAKDPAPTNGNGDASVEEQRYEMICAQIYEVCHDAGTYKLAHCILDEFKKRGMFKPPVEEIDDIIEKWRFDSRTIPVAGIKVGPKHVKGDFMGYGVMRSGITRKKSKVSLNGKIYWDAAVAVLKKKKVTKNSRISISVLYAEMIKIQPKLEGRNNSFSSMVGLGDSRMAENKISAEKLNGVHHLWLTK